MEGQGNDTFHWNQTKKKKKKKKLKQYNNTRSVIWCWHGMWIWRGPEIENGGKKINERNWNEIGEMKVPGVVKGTDFIGVKRNGIAVAVTVIGGIGSDVSSSEKRDQQVDPYDTTTSHFLLYLLLSFLLCQIRLD